MRYTEEFIRFPKRYAPVTNRLIITELQLTIEINRDDNNDLETLVYRFENPAFVKGESI